MSSKVCVVCGEEFAPQRNGKVKTCGKEECRRQRASDRAEARKRGEFIEGPRANGAVVITGQVGDVGELGVAVADVVARLKKRGRPPALTLVGLGSLVRNVVHGLRSKDRQLYEDALCELAAWSLLNLSRVRANAEDRA